MKWYVDTQWARVDTAVTFARAVACARGPWQSALITGTEAFSGSTRNGAGGGGRKFRKTRDMLVSRLEAIGLIVDFDYGPQNRRRIVIQASR